MEEGFYRYNPDEYHGPTLNYLTMIPAWAGRVQKFADLSETMLRIVPVFFGVLLVLLLLLMVDGLGRAGSVCAAVLTAISPAMVYYSRYYIQEMLLVCFTFGAIVFGYRYTKNRNIGWVLLAGVFLGLMHATKETCIIAFGSMLLALLLTLIVRGRQHGSVLNAVKVVKSSHIIAGLMAAVVVSALFYSSFFSNPIGILDSFRTYITYLNRAGQNQLHIHPWYYYLKMLLYYKYGPGPFWSEALIVVLAAVGFVIAIRGKGLGDVNFHLLRFIAFYTLLMTLVYSVIPYKTPWCLLGFLHGMILLAAVGAVTLIKLVPNVLLRVLIGLLLFAGGAHLAWQGYLSNYKYYADSRNPYVYAHPTTDVFTITKRIEELAEAHPDGLSMPVQVICPGGDYWPLPWYFRHFKKVWWWTDIDKNVMPAPVIIASASMEPKLMEYFFLPPPGQMNLYIPLFDTYLELRPKIELRGYVTKDLSDSYHLYQSEQKSSQSRSGKMTQPQGETYFVKSDWDSITGVRRFYHEAMATTFEVLILHEDDHYARQAAQAAFDKLDELEQELSRYVENSDISRINNLAAGQSAKVGLDTFECLQISRRIFAETNGAFDITVGSLMSCWLNQDKSLRVPSKEELNFALRRTGMDLLRLDESRYTVELLRDDVQIDLGGIGKGYAIDKMTELLHDWSIDVALIHGGYSTALGIGSPRETKGWPVTLSNPRDRKQTLAGLCLQNRALSGSGLQKGRHIIDPRKQKPVEGSSAAWACAADAATADALSTAFMVMSPDEVKQYCSRHKDVLAMIILHDETKKKQKDRILHFGQWKKSDLR
ncbi:MAG: flippase activity-associated protein Agl23 [Planctomycetota bacterium]